MEHIAGFILFWAISYIGYRVSRRFKVPAPAILGPIILFMLLSLLNIKLTVPKWQKPLLSIFTGILLGIRLNRNLKGVYKPVLVYAVWLVLLTIAGEKLLVAAGIDKVTAFFAATPGGMAEITLMSLDYGTDSFVTVLLQTSRMLISMSVFSAIASRYRNDETKMEQLPINVAERKKVPNFLWVILFVGSLIGATLLKKLHVPVPNILAPMLIVGATMRMGKFSCKIDKKVQTVIQLGIGGLTGLSITRESMLGIPHYIIPVLLLSTVVIGAGLIMARILMHFTNWDKATCILSCCPAGLSPTIMVAMEYGANANIVTIFQVLRMVTVLVATPIMVELIL